jgi:tetratricopeptide (TPR) repeat protein
MIRVDLKRFTGETVSTAFTRSNGEFEFAGITNGAYQVVIDVQEYEPIRENVEIQNFNKAGMILYLRKPLQLNVVPKGDSISAHQLSLPRKAQDAFQKGMERLYDKDDAQGSLLHFQKAIAGAADFYEAYFEMGVAYAHLKQLTEAEAAFRKAVELSQEHYVQAEIALAALLSNIGRFAEAEPFARLGMDLDRTMWQGHFELARALVGINQWEEAEKRALEAKAIKSDVPQVYLLLANIHIKKQNYPALVDDLESYLKIEPEGTSSAQARNTIEQVRRLMATAKNAPPSKPVP